MRKRARTFHDGHLRRQRNEGWHERGRWRRRCAATTLTARLHTDQRRFAGVGRVRLEVHMGLWRQCKQTADLVAVFGQVKTGLIEAAKKLSIEPPVVQATVTVASPCLEPCAVHVCVRQVQLEHHRMDVEREGGMQSAYLVSLLCLCLSASLSAPPKALPNAPSPNHPAPG